MLSGVWTHRLAAFTIAEVMLFSCPPLQLQWSVQKVPRGPALHAQALLGSDAAWSEAEPGSRDGFAQQALGSCVECLEDAEPRVRLAVGACLRVLAQQQGIAVWDAVSGAILASIERSWVRTMHAS